MLPMLRLREARLARGWSQRKLGARSGVRWQTISNIETGYLRPKPTARSLRRLSRALGIPPEELLRPVPSHGPRGFSPSPAEQTLARGVTEEELRDLLDRPPRFAQARTSGVLRSRR